MKINEITDLSNWENVAQSVREATRIRSLVWKLNEDNLCSEAAEFVNSNRHRVVNHENSVGNVLKGVEVALKADLPNDYFSFLKRVSLNPVRLGKMLRWTEFYATRESLAAKLEDDLEEVQPHEDIQHWVEVARRHFAAGSKHPPSGSYKRRGIKQTARAFAIPLQELREATAKSGTGYDTSILFDYLAKRGLLLNKNPGKNVEAYLLTKIKKDEPCVVVATQNQDLQTPKYIQEARGFDTLVLPEPYFDVKENMYKQFIADTFYWHVSNSIQERGRVLLSQAINNEPARADELFIRRTGLSLAEVVQPFINPVEY
jgi:hypothetical protein